MANPGRQYEPKQYNRSLERQSGRLFLCPHGRSGRCARRGAFLWCRHGRHDYGGDRRWQLDQQDDDLPVGRRRQELPLMWIGERKNEIALKISLERPMARSWPKNLRERHNKATPLHFLKSPGSRVRLVDLDRRFSSSTTIPSSLAVISAYSKRTAITSIAARAPTWRCDCRAPRTTMLSSGTSAATTARFAAWATAARSFCCRMAWPSPVRWPPFVAAPTAICSNPSPTSAC